MGDNASLLDDWRRGLVISSSGVVIFARGTFLLEIPVRAMLNRGGVTCPLLRTLTVFRLTFHESRALSRKRQVLAVQGCLHELST